MRRILAAVVAFALPSFSAAGGLPATHKGTKSLDFALEFGDAELNFNYTNGPSVDTRLKWIGLTWYEQIAPRLELGLHGGRLFLTQTGSAVTAGIEPDGYYAGVGLRAVIAEMSGAQFFLHARYTYQRVEHNIEGQSVTLSWDEPCARLGLATTSWRAFRVYTGAEWINIDGQERVNGTTSSTTNFKLDDNVGGFLGLDLNVEHDGYVGLELRSGPARGAEFYFKKYF